MGLAAVPDWTPSARDRWIEFQLTNLINRFQHEKAREKRLQLWAQIADLHRKRSPRMVAHLEKNKGLFRG